jgi:histidinol-phosphate phosphatase family protein
LTGTFDVVIPTVGRESLRPLLDALARAEGPRPRSIVVVDDQRAHAGPAAARNTGWRATASPWVAFLDDDVVVGPRWYEDLARDLAAAERSGGAPVAGVQGRIVVPLPPDRRPTDWERNVAGLAGARWATADMAYRRDALEAVGGFDERFPRAYREDADLALRVHAAGYRLTVGDRVTTHPVRPAERWISVRSQRGNADDALMRAKHGRRWRDAAAIPRGRRARHLAITASAVCAVAGSRLGLAVWSLGTAELAFARSLPGPRTRHELATMVATSVVIPPAASAAWINGWWRVARPTAVARPKAVLFDRDGTLVVDVPYNGDPECVRPMPGAEEALDLLRNEGIPTAVVSNQSGIGRGLLDAGSVAAVNARVDELLGPLGPWAVCPHAADDGCACRKPRPGLVHEAARALGLDARDVAVIGDIGADIDAARAAGARAVLVPTRRTRAEEIASAVDVARDLPSAVRLLLNGTRRP